MARNFIDAFQNYSPINEQERFDKTAALQLIDVFGEKLLDRQNLAVHVSASGFIVNHDRTKALVVYHNIYKAWTWTGGHADGDRNLLHVALREAEEETGIIGAKALSEEIAVLDILTVPAHIKCGHYVGTHLHLSAGYLLTADDSLLLSVKPDENSGVQWILLRELFSFCTEPAMAGVYRKLLARLS